MKDTELDYVVAPAREGGGWKSVTLASLDGKLLALKISPPLSAAYYPKSGEYARPLARGRDQSTDSGSCRRRCCISQGKRR